MLEAQGNLWDFYERPEAVVCITTNGTVKTNGACVMGRGCAKEAMIRFPDLPLGVGAHIKTEGNIPLYCRGWKLFTFPVKHEWWERADLQLIQESAQILANYAKERPALVFYLPRPGCGNGKLDWNTEVKPLLESLDLPDNIVIVSF